MKNPILTEMNNFVDFKAITAFSIKEATEKTIAEARKKLETIYSIENNTFQNTVEELDNIENDLNTVSSVIYLMAYTHVEEDVRKEAQNAINEFDRLGNEIILDEKLYEAFKKFATTQEAANLKDDKKKYFTETLKEFERNGLGLEADKKEELKKWKDELSEKSMQFSTNINDYQDFILVSESETEGLPEDYRKEHRQADGTYKIDLSYPSYRPFMKYAKAENKRKELLIKYLNKAAQKNVPLLNEILELRNKIATILGYSSHAAYKLENKMAKKPEVVWNFEERLRNKLSEKVDFDYNELLNVKRNYFNNNAIDQINSWETSFFDNILLKEKYSVDSEVVKEYFELTNVIKGCFHICESLYGVTFNKIEGSVWHESVEMYLVKKENNIIAWFYLDLFPRDNKYGHAAMFSLNASKQTANGFQLPSAALVCNFPKPTEDRPSLLPHSEVETFFHEFGHLMHSLLSVTALASQSGTSVSRDFVETPSQMFENWVWNYEALQLFAHHYKTNEVIPKDLFHKLLAAKNVGSGIVNIQQIFYGMLDMTLHDKYLPSQNETTTDVVKRLQNEITPFSYIENTAFQAGFGHLVGYSAGYYGYLWARVYAEDVFSVFEENGILNPLIGNHFCETILSKGGSKDEFEMLKDFLKREPNEEAFIKSIGL